MLTGTSWCTDLYEEILPGKFINGHTTELICHNSEIGVNIYFFYFSFKPSNNTE